MPERGAGLFGAPDHSLRAMLGSFSRDHGVAI
jgi:hypothetical protein